MIDFDCINHNTRVQFCTKNNYFQRLQDVGWELATGVTAVC